MDRPARPVGIVLVVLADALLGIISISMGVLGIFVGSATSTVPAPFYVGPSPTVMILLSLLAVALGILAFATTYGMWTIQPWGHTLQKVLCGCDIVANVGQLLLERLTAASLLSVVGLIVDVAILVYILQPEIRELYDCGESAEDW
jgi:hypothetical protein